MKVTIGYILVLTDASKTCRGGCTQAIIKGRKIATPKDTRVFKVGVVFDFCIQSLVLTNPA